MLECYKRRQRKLKKSDFLDILKNSLAGEVSRDVIDKNISYYNQYISSQPSEEEAISEIGDPRLIAKTIIETEKAALKGRFGDNNRYSTYRTQEQENYNEKKSERHRNIFINGFSWYHKLIIALVILVVVIVIAFIARILLGILFAFGVPILLVLFLIAMFRKR